MTVPVFALRQIRPQIRPVLYAIVYTGESFLLLCLSVYFPSYVNVTFFFTLLFTTVLSQWNFSHGKFGLPSPGKASCNSVALPNLQGMLGVLVFP